MVAKLACYQIVRQERKGEQLLYFQNLCPPSPHSQNDEIIEARSMIPRIGALRWVAQVADLQPLVRPVIFLLLFLTFPGRNIKIGQLDFRQFIMNCRKTVFKIIGRSCLENFYKLIGRSFLAQIIIRFVERSLLELQEDQNQISGKDHNQISRKIIFKIVGRS